MFFALLFLGGCNIKETTPDIREYEVSHIEGVDKEVKDFFNVTVDTVENDTYEVT